MVGGWGNPRMRNETEFLVLDGLYSAPLFDSLDMVFPSLTNELGRMVALASAALTIFHPGYFYPYMRTGYIESEGTQLSSVEPSSASIISTKPDNRT